MAMYAEAAVTKLQAEQARARKLEQELEKVRRRQGLAPPAEPKGPSHLPGFLWPTHQHDTKLGGATYSKAGMKMKTSRGGRRAAASDAGSDASASPSITTADIKGWSNQLRGSSGPNHPGPGASTSTSGGSSRKFKSSAIHIEKVNATHLSDEVTYPNRSDSDHRRGRGASDVKSSSSQLERLAEDRVGSGEQFQMMVNIPVHELSAMRKRMESLEASVAHVMEDPSVVKDWDGTFDTAVRELAQAAKEVDIASEQAQAVGARNDKVYDAENKLESWSKLVCRHPEYLAKEAEFARWWDEEHAEKHTQALAVMRKIFPRRAVLPEIQSRRDLRRRWGVDRDCAKRLWQRKILSFIWMEPEEIDALHYSELDRKYWSYGLDIVEMRAVYAQLPEGFSSDLDLDGKKTEWLRNFRDVLVDLSAEEQAGTLSDARARHACYRPREQGGQELSEHERILMNFFDKYEPSYANIKKVRQLSNFFKARVERDDKAALASKSSSGGAAWRGGSAVAQYRSLFAAVSHEGRTQQEVSAERRRVLAQERVWRTVMYDEFTKYYRADPRRVWQFSKAAHQQKRSVGGDYDGVVRQHGLLLQQQQQRGSNGDGKGSPRARKRLAIEPANAAAAAAMGSDAALAAVGCDFATAAFGAMRAEFSRHGAVCAEPLLADSPLENAAAVHGNLVAIERGGVSFVQKARHAQAAGAAGIVFVNTDEELFQVGGEDGDEDISLPVVGLRASDGASLLRVAAALAEHGGAEDGGGDMAPPTLVSFTFDRSEEEEEEEEEEDDADYSSDEDEDYDEYDDGAESDSDGSEWDADRFAALIPPGTMDRLQDEMRAVVTALGIDPQRPAGSEAWDQRVETMQRERARVAEQKRAEAELQARVQSGEAVEKFAGGKGWRSPDKRGGGASRRGGRGGGGGRQQRQQQRQQQQQQQQQQPQQQQQRKGLGEIIREEEMLEVKRSASPEVTLAGGVGRAKQKFEAIHRTTR